MPASVLLSSEHKLEVSLRTLTSADSNGVCLSDDRERLRTRISRSSPTSLRDKATAAVNPT